MANPHFGTWGDFWKHLCLAEVLAAVRPREYWESHAGAARYQLIPSRERHHGIYRILERLGASPELATSKIAPLLSDLEVPGSPLIALEIADPRARHLFCDLDLGALRDILSAVRERRGSAIGALCVNGDGPSVVMEALGRVEPKRLDRLFLLVDPFVAFRGDGDRPSGAQLFAHAAARGARCMLWFGYNSPNRRRYTWSVVQRELARLGPHPEGSLWRGEVRLRAWRRSESSGTLLGSVVICHRVPRPATERCAQLGAALCQLYRGSRISPELPGDLELAESP